MNQLDEDIYFLKEAFKSARDLSQDATTQTGALIVSTSKGIERGANRIHYGMPGRFFEGEEKRLLLKAPDKYLFLIHAEKDVLLTTIRKGYSSSLEGSTLYSTWDPCITCATIAINLGIKKFVTHKACSDWYLEAKKEPKQRKDWSDSLKQAIGLLKEGGIEYKCLNKKIGGVSIIFDGKERTP